MLHPLRLSRCRDERAASSLEVTRIPYARRVSQHFGAVLLLQQDRVDSEPASIQRLELREELATELIWLRCERLQVTLEPA